MKCPKCQFDNPEGTHFCGNCAAPLPHSEGSSRPATKTLETSIQELTRGTSFANRYDIIEELGSGGMAKVYRAYDTKIQEDVALKLIKSEISADETMIDRFRIELKLARKITHKNVCRMHDLNEEHGTHYITMEYVPGEDLKSLIKRMGKIPIEKTISVAKQVCMGLKEAHSLGTTHRDLKPQNIMIDRDGNARIMDFGIARSVQVEGVTQEGKAIGTPDYMSPEQVRGQDVDQRSDIYSLGATLYEMLTGKVPFEDKTLYSIAMKQLTEIPKPPRELNSQISDDLNVFILRCMEKEKERRYQNVQELLIALEKLEPTPLLIEEKDIATKKEKRLPPVWIIGILILGAIIIVAGYLLFNKGSRPESMVLDSQAAEWQNSIAVLPFRDLSPEQDQEHFIFGMADAINDRLTQLNVLKVTSTTSVMRYRNTEKDIQQIGQELGVAHILEGSIQTEGEKIRVRAQLINAENRFHLWSDTFEQERKSVFVVQDRVSEAIAEALKIELMPDAFADLEKDRPKNFEAYEYYLKGMNYISSRWLVTEDEKDFETAVGMFEKALEIDPQYSLAYSGMAYGYMLLGAGFSRPEAWKEMEKYNDKAYELDPESAMASIMKAATLHVNGKYEQALSFCRSALDLNPNLAEVNFTAGVICRQLGLLNKAIKYAEKSVALDPYNPLAFGIAGISYSYLNEPEKALPFWEKAYELMPAFTFMHLSRAHMVMGNYERAEEIIKIAEESGVGKNRIEQTRALLFSFMGEREKALNLRKGVWAVWIYALLGMKAEAMEIIEENISRPIEFNYLYIKNYSVFDNLRDEPRFQKIMAIQKQKYEERLKWAANF